VNAEGPVIAGELSRLKKAKRVLEKKVESLTEANADLALELRESMPAAIFSRATPEGKNANLIRGRMEDMISPLRDEIESCQEKINSLTKLSNKMKLDLKEKDADVKQLTREKRVCVQEIRELKKSVGSFFTDEELTEERVKMEEEEDKKAASYLEDLQIIHILLTGISASAAAAQPNVIKKATYCNDMRMRLGWFQEIINGFYIAQCGRINEIGHDGGSISEAESLCVSIIITDSIGENPNHLVLSASALPAD